MVVLVSYPEYRARRVRGLLLIDCLYYLQTLPNLLLYTRDGLSYVAAIESATRVESVALVSPDKISLGTPATVFAQSRSTFSN